MLVYNNLYQIIIYYTDPVYISRSMYVGHFNDNKYHAYSIHNARYNYFFSNHLFIHLFFS